MLTAQRTAQVQCGGLNLENLKQFSANIQADRRPFGVITADRGVFAHRFGTQAGGVDTDGDDALPAGENFAGEIPAGAASARFDVGDPQDLRANIAKLVGVLDDGSLQDGSPVMIQCFELDRWASSSCGRGGGRWWAQIVLVGDESVLGRGLCECCRRIGRGSADRNDHRHVQEHPRGKHPHQRVLHRPS